MATTQELETPMACILGLSLGGHRRWCLRSIGRTNGSARTLTPDSCEGGNQE